MRTIAIINQKGGCGKTTTAINLAAAFARAGQETLLVDMDPQSHCALGLAVPEKQIGGHIGDALLADRHRPFNTAPITWQVASGLDLIPSTVALAAVERQLANEPDKDLRLASVLHRLRDDYRFCLIDCPPSIGLLTFNALRAAGEVIIPVETGYFALKGAVKQAATLDAMGKRIGHKPTLHVLATMYDVRTRQAREILADLHRQFGKRVLPAPIHYSVKIKEATGFGQPILEYDATSRGADDFEQLAAHLLAHAPASNDPLPEVILPEESAQAEIDGSISTGASPMADRAAELVRRARALQQKTDQMRRRLEADPDVAGAQGLRDMADGPTRGESRNHLSDRLAHLYGVRQTEQGALFCQPQNHAHEIRIAGDFNNWQPTRAPMRRNEKLDVWELCLPLPPGRYRYRLVVDGRWTSDPHNRNVEINPYGELNSIVEMA